MGRASRAKQQQRKSQQQPAVSVRRHPSPAPVTDDSAPELPDGLLGRMVAVRADSFDEERNAVTVLWTTGARVKRYDWWEDRYWYEELATEPEAINLERLDSGRAPFLNTHSSRTLDDVLGVVLAGTVRQVADGWEADVRLSEEPSDAPVVNKIRSGIVANVSVGYEVTEWDDPFDADDGLPVYRAATWTPFELSAVPMGADSAAHVRGNAEPGRMPGMPRTRGDEMAGRNIPAQSTDVPEDGQVAEQPEGSTRTQPTPSASDATAAAVDEDAIARRIEERVNARVDAEHERIREIRRLRALPLFDGIAGADDLVDKLIAERTSLDGKNGARDQLMRLAAESDRHNAPSGVGVITAGSQDARATMRQGIQDAMLHRVMPGHFAMTEVGRGYAGRNWVRLSEDFLVGEGVDVRGMTPRQIAHRAMTFRSEFSSRSGGHSTSDFPNILANVSTNAMRKGYEMYPQRWRQAVSIGYVPDFKAAKRSQFTANFVPKTKLEGGPVKFGSADDEAETVQLVTYAVEVHITHEALVNDSMGVFGSIPFKLGQGAASKESDLVIGVLTDNANMADGIALFHASHANLATGAPADPLSITTLGAALAAMSKQTDAKGNYVNAQGRYIWVPAVLELALAQIIEPFVPATAANNAPEYIRMLRPIADPRLDANSTTAWYVSADPMQMDTIELTYLEGEEGLQVDQEIQFVSGDLKVGGRLACTATPLDHRGLYKNEG